MVNPRLWSFKFRGSSVLEMVKSQNDQPGNYETRPGALWTMLIITLRVTGMELSGFVALIHGLDISRDWYKGVAWDSYEFKVI